MKKIVVIGAGFGGLAIAALLAKQGHQVTVIEKNSMPGGRAMIYKSKGFTFDMGPSWYLMPDIFERFFKEFGHKPTDFYKLKRLDPNYRIIYGKKDIIDINQKLKDNKKLFESIEPGSTEKIKNLIDISRENYKIAIDQFVYKNYDNVFDFFDFKIAKEALKLGVLKSLDSFISKFVKTDKIKKILEYNVVFLGGSPKNLPGLYSIMAHVDFNLGVWYPMGGMFEVVKAIVQLGKKYKVKYLYNSPVSKIVVENGKATGVQVGKKVIPADIVVSNADYHFTETRMLEQKDQSYPESYWKKTVLAPSAFLMYLGVKGKVKNLKHHNLYFAEDWDTHFKQIFDKPEWPEKPSYYVCAPSKSDPKVAPKGKENLFVLVPIAPGLPDTAAVRKKYEKQILSHLEEILGEDFSKRILTKRIFTIKDFEKNYNAYKGNALSLAHTFMQSAVFRPKNVSKKVKNLVYVGQYTTPGVGVPMALISAQIAMERINKIAGEK